MGFVKDILGDITGANAMEEATGIQRDQFNYWKNLNEEDRKAMLKILDEGEVSGYFDPNLRLKHYDDAVGFANDRELRNIKGNVEVAGGRPGDTNADAAVAMAVNKHRTDRGNAFMKFFNDAFKDRFALRQAIAGNTQALAQRAGENLSSSLMGQGQQQQQQFGGLLGLIGGSLFKPGADGKQPPPAGGGQTTWGESSGGGTGGNLPMTTEGGQSVPTNNGGMTSFMQNYKDWIA